MTYDCILSAWHTFESEISRFLTRHLGDRTQAEDLLHDVFLKAMRQGQRFCTIENPRSWLFQVARTTLIDHTRLRKPFVELPDDLIADDKDERAPVDELDACLVRNLAEMLPEDRDIIECCDLKEQTVREFADNRGLSLAAAKSRLLRARKRLREALVHNCQVRFDDTGNVCCHLPREPL